jgi:hypothetical protein
MPAMPASISLREPMLGRQKIDAFISDFLPVLFVRDVPRFAVAFFGERITLIVRVNAEFGFADGGLPCEIAANSQMVAEAFG